MNTIESDIKILKRKLKKLPTFWDGKESILELKEANYNWRQMEWWAFYFELKAKEILQKDFCFPGEKFGSVEFDLKRSINWDLKASAIKTNYHKIILNDKKAMDESLKECKYHGEIIALCDVEYNDTNRSFQKWHDELKGNKSQYVIEREERTSMSRYRKTKANLTEVLILILSKKEVQYLDIMKQGRNSNGKERPVKYVLDLEFLNNFYTEVVKF